VDAVIDIADLTVAYGDFTAVDAISLAVPRGEIFGFVGPNGAGKSSTIRTLLDLQHPQSGTVRILGEDVRQAGAELRRRIGYLPGDLGLYGFLTGRKTLRFFADLYQCSEPDGQNVLERLRFPDGALDRKVSSYSTGMRQMLGIAICFQHHPELVILDEPTTGLDPMVRESFLSFIKEYRKGGRTIFFSNHVLAEVEDIADRIALIYKGQLKLTERVDKLKATLEKRVTLIRKDGTRESFSTKASPKELQETLDWDDLVDIEIRPADLREVFRQAVEEDS
jgi:ABC-2 type transport system ATP-binding protein